MKIQVGTLTVNLDEATLQLSILADGKLWQTIEGWESTVVLEERKAVFADWEEITHIPFTCGVGAGIHSTYRKYQGEENGYAFDTLIWIEEANATLHMEWIPICEDGLKVKEVHWPGSLCRKSENNSEEGYTVLNAGQGLLVPDTWPVEMTKLHFNGMFLTAGSYMPWFGQVKHKS